MTKKLTGRELKADEFEFTLTDQDGNVKETVKNDKDGNVKFSELEFDKAGTYTYKIAEKAGTATGIQYDTKTITATVTVVDNGKGVLEATVAYDGEKVFENTYTPAGATSVTLGAKKVLEGKDLEAGKYSFELKKEDGSVVETVKNAADGTVTFSPISYDESQVGTHKYTISEVAGSEAGITYDKTVQEVEVTVEKVSVTELKATASKEAKDLVFTNKYTPAKTQVSVKKAWDDKDNQDGKRPSSVTVKLLADGQDTDKTLELNAANGWTGSFTDLDADKGGTPIQYTVVEVTVPGYTSKVTGDAASGFTITNSYSPETVNVKATKNWDDANNQDGKRPTKITINLLADGQKVASKEVQEAADGTWTVEFTKLAKYKAGKEIKYTVTEEAVAEYESTITDFTITNKYEPKEIDYKVTKVWNDANNQDGKRPESVTVQLYKKVGDADPVAVEGKKLTLTASGDKAVVIGDGAVGQCAVIAAKMRGASQIVLMSRHEDRQKIALESGATAVVAERGEEVIAKVREIRGGGADAALECVGTAAAVDQALEVLHNGGRLGFVGVPHYNNRALGSTFAQISQLQVELPLLPPTTNSYYSRLYWMEISIQDESSPRAIVWTRLIKHTKTWMSVRPLRL